MRSGSWHAQFLVHEKHIHVPCENSRLRAGEKGHGQRGLCGGASAAQGGWACGIDKPPPPPEQHAWFCAMNSCASSSSTQPLMWKRQRWQYRSGHVVHHRGSGKSPRHDFSPSGGLTGTNVGAGGKR